MPTDLIVVMNPNFPHRTTSGANLRRGGAGAKLLVCLVVVFAFAAMAWMLFLPVVLTTQLRQRTGFDATVKSVAANPFTGTVKIRGLALMNPPTFPVRDFLEVRELSADFEMFTLLADRPVISSVVIDAAKVTLVRREAGWTNAAAFHEHLVSPDDQPRPARRVPHFLVRQLDVRIDELVIADHSTRLPTVQTYRLDLHHTYSNVTKMRQLLVPAALQGLIPVGVALNGLLPGYLGEALSEVIREATKTSSGLPKDAGVKGMEKSKGYFDALEESKKP